jgi:hypothetical protein
MAKGGLRSTQKNVVKDIPYIKLQIIKLLANGGGGGIGEAPNDGQQYARQSLDWQVVAGGGSTPTLAEVTAEGNSTPLEIISGLGLPPFNFTTRLAPAYILADSVIASTQIYSDTILRKDGPTGNQITIAWRPEDDNGYITVPGGVSSATFAIQTYSTSPTDIPTPTSLGNRGEIRCLLGYTYICVTKDIWIRIANDVTW